MAVVLQRQPPRRTVIGVVERQFDFVLDIAPLATAGPAATRGGAAAESAAEKRCEEVGEGVLIPEHLLHFFLRHRAEAALAAAGVHIPLPGKGIWSARTLRLFVRTPVRAELVVFLPLGGITEHLVRLVDFLELRLGGLIAGVDVGMMLAGELAEGLFDLFVRRRFADPKGGVIVFEFHVTGPPSRSNGGSQKPVASARRRYSMRVHPSAVESGAPPRRSTATAVLRQG